MTNCILAAPTQEGLYAEAGPYRGPLDIEQIIYDSEFCEWEGRAARYFIPVSYYHQYMPDNGEGFFEETYAGYSHFVFLENNDDKELVDPILIDEEWYMIGEWACFLWNDGLAGFPEDSHAQGFFYWLTSPKIQGLIYDKHKTEGTKVRFSPSTRLI